MIKIKLLKGRDDNCPFWKTPRAENDEEVIAWTEKRISVGDANAVGLLGFKYSRGESGLPQYLRRCLSCTRVQLNLDKQKHISILELCTTRECTWSVI
jgi:hypothetical protein